MATEAEARWLVAVDRDTGDMYYFNEATDETLWELPAGVYPSGLAVLRGELDDELVDEGEPRERVFAREGFLMKSPVGAGKWRKRWLVADRVTRTMTWYASNPRQSMARLKVSEPVKGSLSLVGARLCRSRAELPAGTSVNSSPPHAHELFVVTTGRTLHLSGPSPSDIAGWCTYLERAIEGRSSHSGAKVREVAARAGGPPRGTIASATMSEAIVPRALTSPVSVSAWVHKLNPDGHSWDERWATLKPEALTFSYYVGSGREDRCCRVVDLTYATLQGGCASPADPTADPTLRRSPGFRLQVHAASGSRDPERTLVFVCPDFNEAQTWVNAIFTAMELGVPARADVFKRKSSKSAAGPTPRPPGVAAPAPAAAAAPARTGRVPRLSEIPVLQTTLFKANPAGTKWGARTLVLVAHASKAHFAPGVTAGDCPCIAYYKGSDPSSGPKGIIHLEDVREVAATAPQAVRRSAPGAFILTISTGDRAYYISAKNEAELVRWRDAIFEVAEAWNASQDE